MPVSDRQSLPFEKIRVQGFRRLADVNLSLKPLNVVIGANGCGKTSLLDVFSLLAASARGELNQTFSNLGGLNTNLTNLCVGNGDQHRSMRFELVMPVPHYNPINYHVAFEPKGTAYEIVEESLTQQRSSEPPPFKHLEARHGDVRYFDGQGLVRPDWDYHPRESGLSQVPKMFKEPEEFRNRLASSTHYHLFDVSQGAPARLPQQMREATLPGPAGETLISCLYTIRETDPDRFENIEATLRTAFPSFERLSFPPVAAGMLAMTWKDETSPEPFFMHQLSEGTLRFLWLATLLQSPGLTSVTLLDEPEVSLHPELLSFLADLMREASQQTQLIVATHADRLVRYLRPSEVLTIDIKDNGAAEMTWADDLDLEQWLDEYTLDEVWRLGRMGARP